MTDKELIQALRNCGTHPVRCKSCPYNGVKVCADVLKNGTADRLESLLDENEWLKAQMPKWVSVDERLPESNDISTEMCKQCLLDKLQQPCEDSPTVEKG